MCQFDLGRTVFELILYEGAAINSTAQSEHLGCRKITLEGGRLLRTKDVRIDAAQGFRETYSRATICDPLGYHIELRQWFINGRCNNSLRTRWVM